MPPFKKTKLKSKNEHCVKSVRIRSFLLRNFPHLDWIQGDTPYSARIREKPEKLRIRTHFTQWKEKKMFEDMWMKSRSEISLILDFRDREFLFLSFSYFLVKRVIYNLETFSDQVKRDQRIENTSYLWRFWAHSKLVLVVGHVSVFRTIKIIYWN